MLTPILRLTAADAREWRYWQAEQGLADSHIGCINRDGGGAIWASHGDVPALTRFDGRKPTLVSAPQIYQRFDSLDGSSGWVADIRGLHYRHDGRWDSFPRLELASNIRDINCDLRVIDLGSSLALILLPDRLARFSAKTGRIEPLQFPPAGSGLGKLVSYARAFDGTFWVVGDKGAAHFSYGPSAVGPSEWKDYQLPNIGVGELNFPILSFNGDLFVSGVRTGSKRRVALRLQNGQWQIVAEKPPSGERLRAWLDGNGDLWLADGNTLLRKRSETPGADWQGVDQQNEVLPGRVNQIIVTPDGSFFLASSRGLALHVVDSWKTWDDRTASHGKLLHVQQHISSLLEDHLGRLWFLAQRSLFRFHSGQWIEYPFEKDYVIDPNQPNSLAEGRDGQILIQAEASNFLVAFDPESRKYSAFEAPAGYRPLMFMKRSDGKILAAMFNLGAGSDALAIVDGNSFTQVTQANAKWNLNYPRGMAESNTGEIWLAGTGGLWRISNGKSEQIQFAGKTADLRPEGKGFFSLLAEQDGRMLAGGRTGLYRWTGSRLDLIADGIQAPRRLIRDRSGDVWAASGAGVLRSLRRGLSGEAGADSITNDTFDGLPSTTIQSMLQDRSGLLWVATNKGIATYGPGIDSAPPATAIRTDQNFSEAPPSGEFRIIASAKDKWELTPPDLLQFSYRIDGGEWSPFAKTGIATFHKL